MLMISQKVKDLYKKGVSIRHYQLKLRDDIMKIYVSAVELYDNKIYFFAKKYNLLFSVDISTSKLEFLDMIPEYDCCNNDLCSDMVLFEDKLFIASKKYEKIWVYNIKTNNWSMVKINNSGFQKTGFNQIIVDKEKLFFVGRYYPAIVSYNAISGDIEYIDKPYIDVKERLSKDPIEPYFGQSYFKKDDTVYLASCNDNYVLKLNLSTKEKIWYKVGDNNHKYSGINGDGKIFWLSYEYGIGIVKWDGENAIDEDVSLNLGYDEAKWLLGVFSQKQSMIVANMVDNKSILIDRKKNITNVINQKYCYYVNKNNFDCYQTDDGILTLIDYNKFEKKIDLDLSFSDVNNFYLKRGFNIKEKMNLIKEKEYSIYDLIGMI